MMKYDQTFYVLQVSLPGTDTEMFEAGNGRNLIEYFFGHDVRTYK